MYEQREYLSNIKLPQNMSIFTKFRIDAEALEKKDNKQYLYKW